MKKILYVNAISDNIGGIEMYIMNIYRKIDKSKYDVHFLVDENIKPVYYDEIKNNIITTPSRTKNYKAYLKKLKKIMRKYQYDVVHVNLMSFSNFEPIVFAKKYSKAKIILHSHISNLEMSFKTKILNYIGRKLVKKYEKSGYIKVACSSMAGEWMFHSFKDKTFTVLNNGINVLKYKYNTYSRNQIRKKLNIGKNDILLGNVGRLCSQKNQKFLIELLKRLDSNYKLLIIGKGELKNDLIELSKKYQVFNRLILLEDIYNVEEYLSAMDIFVFPSLYEGLGIAVIEAEANGLQVFASNTIPQDVVVTSNIKLLPLIENDWFDEIKKCDHKDRNKDFKKLIFEFDYDETTKKVLNIYDDIIKGE